MSLAESTVGASLADPATRTATLGALEQTHGPHDRALALAAAAALGALLCRADEADVDVPTARRVGLLIARMCADAPDDPACIWGAAMAEGRYAAMFNAPAFARVCTTPAAELTSEMALTYVCAWEAWWPPGAMRGFTATFAAAGFATGLDGVGVWMGQHPIMKKRMPSGEIPLRMSELLHAMLRSPESLPEYAAAGALAGLKTCVMGRPEVAKQLVQAGVFETLATYLKKMGSVAEWSVRQLPYPIIHAFSSASS